jgi:HAD superfamily hydrolase (TIGR01450 family)
VTTAWCGAVLDLGDVRGFVFDIDGTLLHRGPDGRARPQPGAVDVLERIRAGGRRLALFTNGSHVPSARIAEGLRENGLPVSDDELITPVDSATTFLLANHADEPVLLFASAAVRDHLAARGVRLADGEDARVVLVAHRQQVDMDDLDRAARAVVAGAPLYTGSYVPGYAGANGMIFSRNSMIAAAIAKVTGVRPRVLGKPSRPAVAELRHRLGIPTAELAVIGDDLGMDVALGRMGGSRTVLVRSGISGQIDLTQVPERRRPDAAVDGVADLLDWL